MYNQYALNFQMLYYFCCRALIIHAIPHNLHPFHIESLIDNLLCSRSHTLFNHFKCFNFNLCLQFVLFLGGSGQFVLCLCHSIADILSTHNSSSCLLTDCENAQNTYIGVQILYIDAFRSRHFHRSIGMNHCNASGHKIGILSS